MGFSSVIDHQKTKSFKLVEIVKAKIVEIPGERVLLERVKRGFTMGHSIVYKSQTTTFALRIGAFVLVQQFMACLNALETTILKLLKGRRT